MRIPILMYHSISELSGKYGALGVAPSLLDEQLAAIRAAGFDLAGLTEAYGRIAAGESVVALTFDDAYVDFTDGALPVLEKHHATATLYVPTQHVGGNADWLRDGAALLPALMTWPQIGEVHASGRVEVASHSRTHPQLDLLASQELDVEVSRSKTELEDRLQTPVQSFCYPHGYHSRSVRSAVLRSGYSNACEVGRRLRTNADRLALPRLAVGPATSPERLVHEIRNGGPVVVPAVKRAARPAWRIARRVLTAADSR